MKIPAMIISLLFVFLEDVNSNCHRDYYLTGINKYDRQQIIDLHNRLRQLVAVGMVRGHPPAENMKEITWDNNLAADAQRWSQSCNNDVHDEYRHKGYNYKIGQNIATHLTTKEPQNIQNMEAKFVREGIIHWFNEIDHYRFNQSRNYGDFGHYTQLVWAETNRVGCGYALYNDKSKRKFVKKYVCNYGPSGNIQGVAPYQVGYQNCQKYGMSGSYQYVGLCVD